MIRAGWNFEICGASSCFFRAVAGVAGRLECVAEAIGRPPEVGGAIWTIGEALPSGGHAWHYAPTLQAAEDDAEAALAAAA